MLVANLGFAVPSFLVATLLIYWFAVKFDVGLPTSGWDSWQAKILPTIALGFFPMAHFARLVRGTMLETLQQDYVRTARAKGLRWKRVVGLHVLRNSLIPVVAASGPLLGAIITGSFIVETIFAIPGIGRYYVRRSRARLLRDDGDHGPVRIDHHRREPGRRHPVRLPRPPEREDGEPDLATTEHRPRGAREGSTGRSCSRRGQEFEEALSRERP